MEAPVPAPSQSRAIARDLLIVAAAGAAIWLARRLGRIVLILVLAMFLAYLIAPIVELLERPVTIAGRGRRLPRGFAIAAVYLLLVGVAVGGGALFWPSAADQIDHAIASAPTYTESFRTWEHGWSRYYERLRIRLELRHRIDHAAVEAGDAADEYAGGSQVALLGALSGLPWLAWCRCSRS
jgi:predicted PurR-regulated permease PerM